MSKLFSLVADVTGKRDRDLLEATLADVLYRLLQAKRVNLWRVLEHPQGARVRLMAGVSGANSVAMSDPTVETEDLARLDEFAGFCACYDNTTALRMPADEPGLFRHLFPVSSERETIGVLDVEAADELSLAQSEMVDGLLRIYRNHLALLDYSDHDTLTGLLNRKTFDDIFLRRVARQTIADELGHAVELVGRRRVPRPDETPWLAVVDIDFFKRINDRYGHLFGDEVLLLLGRLMRSVFRTNDVLFRFGGEEFVVLLALTDRVGAETALERFRMRVEEFAFPQVGQVSVSIGFTRASLTDSPSDAFDRADEALYYAKQNGRNQVRGYEALLELGVVKPKRVESGDVELF
jgi:diguanylate cyclase (GGDEF)-like protein